MLDKKSLIATLIKQHQNLKAEAVQVLALSKDSSNNQASLIKQTLDQFAKDLQEHLSLENDVFYKELLKGMKAKGQDTEKTEQFISEMKSIEKTIFNFFKKYADKNDIATDISLFHKEFTKIKETLFLRMETEEVGVYSYWGLF